MTLDGSENQTPRGMAAYCGRADALQEMFHHGADTKAACSTGYTALHEAASGNQTGAVGALVEAGANIMARKQKRGETSSRGLKECFF